MTRAALVLVALLVASVLVPVAVAQDAETGDALVGERAEELPETEQGETIISGLDDPDLSLLSAESKGDTVVLEIRSSTSKSIQVLDAFASGGAQATILRPQTRSLSEGVNEIEIEARTISGVHVVNIKGSGGTAQIPIESSGGGWTAPRTDRVYQGVGAALLLIVLYAFGSARILRALRNRVAEEVVEVETERREVA